MNPNPNVRKDEALLYPFPEGWYFVASRKTIEKKGLLKRTWFGEQIVVWCNGEGNVCVAEAICPHLGADLGPESGGRVRNGCLVCPFHGFEFDVSGQCVATPFAPAPRTAKLKVFETREIQGLVFAWWGRRHPTDLRPGDPLDFWRVDAYEENRLLSLRAEMRLPGQAWLQFEVEPAEKGSRITQTAVFQPLGLGGLICWYGLSPIHWIIFRWMLKGIARRAVS